MRFLSLSLLLPLVAGHTTFTTLYVDGVNQGDGVCVRMNRDVSTATFPIEPLANRAMACGYDGEKAVTRVCSANSTSTLTFEFRDYPDASSPGSIDPSHRGPCAVYMKRVDDATEDNNAAGDGWFKIWELGYDSPSGKWCTEKLIDNNGLLSVEIPADIRGGDYLVRPELLALQSAQDTPRDPQFYVGCAQVFVQSDGDAQPETVSIDENTYNLDMEALTYNIFETPLKLPYPSFGPAVYTPGSANGSDGSTERKATESVQTKGLKPEGCILVRDDWCGFEVPSYDTQDGCWASSKHCWDQSDVCWHTALPTGNKNCEIWQQKCTTIDDNCSSGDWVGPPNAGKDLTPVAGKMDGSMKIFTRGTAMNLHRRRRVAGHA
ncbi:hypothetical protein ARAM_000578 [Aspergillus rambellii]|uniref:AA9 family lytic polysaccharide monooxygenase n=1 Tax=Aspergillus rambellii TaxID=308745 RepID=A0A0F8U105_9EURO|nr:hypothetical protein ARAM_000578 [Aspergillus rambellii]